MKIVPLSPLPSQTFNVVLDSQNCTIKLSQKSTGMFLDLAVGQTPVLTGTLCRNLVRVVRQSYLDFSGELMFMDTQGYDDPQYEGLGSRWVLMYLDASDYSSLG